MRGHRLWGFGIITLAVIGMTVWIDAFVISNWAVDLFRGIGVEVIGALITAFGVIGLDRLYAEPDADIKALLKQVEQLNAKIDAMQCHFDEVAHRIDRKPSIAPLSFPPDRV